MQYFVPANRSPKLWGRKDGSTISLRSQNPVTKVNYHRETVYKLYCPRLERSAGFAAITAGVIFPFADAGRVKELLSPFSDGEPGSRSTSALCQPPSGRNAKTSSTYRPVRMVLSNAQGWSCGWAWGSGRTNRCNVRPSSRWYVMKAGDIRCARTIVVPKGA